MGNRNKVVNVIMVTAAVLVGFYFYMTMDPGIPEELTDESRWYWGAKEWKGKQGVPVSVALTDVSR